MKQRQINFLAIITFILLASSLGYYYRVNVNYAWKSLANDLQPCQKPISYTITNLDSRFNLTKEELLDNIKEATKVWETPINKKLFEYSPNGDVKINLVYDSRQKATDALKNIGIVISSDRASYNVLKIKYDSLLVSYNQKKATIDSLLVAYNSASSNYEKNINYWNSRGGAPQGQYDKLEQERIDLNNQVTRINQEKDSLNELADTINLLSANLNKLINTLNLQINTYNTVGSSNGQQFSEGEYISDANKTVINIYQYNNSQDLVGVLTHELGHALGMEHVDNPQAIMYYLNEAGSEKLTTDDLAELKRTCKIK